MPPKTSGKNKRGERGSTDEETADPKRVNMASADFEPSEVVEREDDQPDLSDIHATLKDLLKSMNKLYNEVAELKASFKLQESELRTAKDSLNATLRYNEELKLELKAAKKTGERSRKFTSSTKKWTRSSSIQEKIPLRLRVFLKIFATTKTRF